MGKVKLIFICAVLLFTVVSVSEKEKSWNSHPEFSPDEKKIAFTTNRDGNVEIYVVDINGENLKRLTYHKEVDAELSWSPDGSKIAFNAREAKDKDFEIYVIDSDGKNRTQLTFNDGGDYTPSWTPDGKQIIFSSNRDFPGATDIDGNRELYIMNSDGSNQERITHLSTICTGPVFSPDGRNIAFSSKKDGDYEIYTVRLDGTNLKQLTFNDDNFDWYPRWMGNTLVYTSGKWNPYKWHTRVIDLDNGKETTIYSGVDSGNIGLALKSNKIALSIPDKEGNSTICLGEITADGKISKLKKIPIKY